MAIAFTDQFIKNLSASDRRQEIADAKQRQLYCIVQPSGAVSFAVRYRFAGQPKKLTLGPYPELSLKDAREMARGALGDIARGIDPAREKKVAIQATKEMVANDLKSTFESFIERYGNANLKERTATDYGRLFSKHILPNWGHRPIETLTRKDIVAMIDDVVDGGAPVAANRAFAALRKVLNWCVERGTLNASPANGLKVPTAESARDRILTDDELVRVARAASTLGWPFAPFVHILMLTGQRRDEVASMRWSELDFVQNVWTLPSARTKNANAHWVPLSPEVSTILQPLPRVLDGGRKSDFVFTTTGKTPISGFSRAKSMIDAAILKQMKKDAAHQGIDAADVERMPDWRFHDLRRTMASGMARLGVSIHVVEKILNHTSGTFGGIVGVYQRHDFARERRAALRAWAQYVNQLP